VVLHAAGSGYYEVAVSVTAQRCQVEVAQRSPGSERLRVRAMADPSAERGRGLALMSRLVDHVTIERDGDLAIVVLEKRLSPQE
jgi:anti-sigma regulatory factor (Ser/Thr protein kinase)